MNSGVELEDEITEAFKQRGWITFTRKNQVDVVAVKRGGEVGYVVEAKDYSLSRKHQVLAVRQLNRNYTKALEILVEHGLQVKRLVKVLVARGFAYQSDGIFQFTPQSFLEYLDR